MELIEVRFIAHGEVRDAEGNLISTTADEITTVVTPEQARALMEGDPQ